MRGYSLESSGNGPAEQLLFSQDRRALGPRSCAGYTPLSAWPLIGHLSIENLHPWIVQRLLVQPKTEIAPRPMA